MNELEIEQHKLIVLNCKKLLIMCLSEDTKYIESVMLKSQKAINKYNNNKLSVSDITQKEIGVWNIAVKNYINSTYVTPLANKLEERLSKLKKYDEDDLFEYIHKYKCNLRKKTKSAISSMDFSDLMKKYTLLNRKSKNIYKPTPLEKEIKEAIKIEVISRFQEQIKN